VDSANWASESGTPYLCWVPHSSLLRVGLLTFPVPSRSTPFSQAFPLSRPDPHRLNSALQTLNPQLFNTFPLHSNDIEVIT
jgi:hypothetical protein